MGGSISFRSAKAATNLCRHDAAEVFGPVDLIVEAMGAQPSEEIPGEGSAGIVLVIEMAKDDSTHRATCLFKGVHKAQSSILSGATQQVVSLVVLPAAL